MFQEPTSAPEVSVADQIKEQEATLLALKEQAARDAEEAAKVPVSIESLDARVTELERIVRGGAVE